MRTGQSQHLEAAGRAASAWLQALATATAVAAPCLAARGATAPAPLPPPLPRRGASLAGTTTRGSSQARFLACSCPQALATVLGTASCQVALPIISQACPSAAYCSSTNTILHGAVTHQVGVQQQGCLAGLTMDDINQAWCSTYLPIQGHSCLLLLPLCHRQSLTCLCTALLGPSLSSDASGGHNKGLVLASAVLWRP